MEIRIQELAEAKVSGIRYCRKDELPSHKEAYFDWTAFPLISTLDSTQVTCGFLKAWHCVPEFHMIETHTDKEIFYFIKGTCLMLLCDMRDGAPDLDSAQIVRIREGTCVEIEGNKAHFVAVPDSDYYEALVVAPVQEGPRMELPEPVLAV